MTPVDLLFVLPWCTVVRYHWFDLKIGMLAALCARQSLAMSFCYEKDFSPTYSSRRSEERRVGKESRTWGTTGRGKVAARQYSEDRRYACTFYTSLSNSGSA